MSSGLKERNGGKHPFMGTQAVFRVGKFHISYGSGSGIVTYKLQYIAFTLEVQVKWQMT